MYLSVAALIVATAVGAAGVSPGPATAASAPSPKQVGVSAGPALTDRAGAIILRPAPGGIRVLHDDGAPPIDVALPGCRGLVDAQTGEAMGPDSAGSVVAAAAGTGLAVCVSPSGFGGPPYTPSSAFTLVDLRTGAVRPLPGGDRLALSGHQAMLFAIGSRWAFGQPCYDTQGHCEPQIVVDWRTGEVRNVQLVPPLMSLANPPAGTLDSRTLKPDAAAPRLVYRSGTLSYRRGSLRRVLSRDCGSCAVAVDGRRVAWTRTTPTREYLSILNAMTGRRATVRLDRLTGYSRSTTGLPVLAFTKRRVVVSLPPASPTGPWSVFTVRWPV